MAAISAPPFDALLRTPLVLNLRDLLSAVCSTYGSTSARPAVRGPRIFSTFGVLATAIVAEEFRKFVRVLLGEDEISVAGDVDLAFVIVVDE